MASRSGIRVLPTVCGPRGQTQKPNYLRVEIPTSSEETGYAGTRPGFLIASFEEAVFSPRANIKSHLSRNAQLLEDHPEVVYPIRMLEGEAWRCGGQRFCGRPAQAKWNTSKSS